MPFDAPGALDDCPPMTESAFATATAWSYGLAAVGYAVFGLRVGFGSPKGVRARLLLAALVFTAAWAACSLWAGLTSTARAFLWTGILDALRYGAWFAFLWHLVNQPSIGAPGSPLPRMRLVAVAGMLILSTILGQGLDIASLPQVSGFRAGFILHLAMAVLGLMLVERLVRRVQPRMRWGIKPLALGLAGVFGLDLFCYADATLLGRLDADIWVSRGLANVLVIPFIAIATARNTGWTIDLHLSRGAVFHSSALLLSGIFLLGVAGAGYAVRYFGGEWGRALQFEVVFAAALFAVLVLTSGQFRAKLKVFVSKHFFSYRYDYREEWLRFTRTLSTESGVHTLQARTVIALADLVESPGGALWLKDESGGFAPAARWNTPAVAAVEPAQGSLAAFLTRSSWIVSLPEYRAEPSRYGELVLPDWLSLVGDPWLIVPLISGSGLLGFVVLVTPRTTIDVDWEVRDLLKAASRQAASYLGQVTAAEALIEARKFDAFNRMSAFVVHDLKNLVAQLSLMLKNAQRHRDNPEFQKDMLATAEHVVARMNGLMQQLRIGTSPVESARLVDVDAVLRRACAGKSASPVNIVLESTGALTIEGHEDRLERVIGHLLQNAIDASSAGANVRVSVIGEAGSAVITVSDDGVGMTPEFVRDRLFKPFQTTKAAGMGIGVYESAQYVAGIGGQITVDSRPGLGTDVRVRFPLRPQPPTTTARIVNEAAV